MKHNLKMTNRCLIFYIFDDLNRFFDSLTLNTINIVEPTGSEHGEISLYKFRKKSTTVFQVDGYFLSVFTRLLKMSEVYYDLVVRNLIRFIKSPSGDGDISIKFRLVKPKLEVLDYAWNDRISNLVFQRQELEHAMSWLSTLGGAFSALGDSFENCAKIAGKISIQQFKIAFQLGEPPLVARCRLYMALSLIQLGKLAVAKEMIQEQYEIAKNYKDIRLQNMCKGVWAKLQYTYKQKKINSNKNGL